MADKDFSLKGVLGAEEYDKLLAEAKGTTLMGVLVEQYSHEELMVWIMKRERSHQNELKFVRGSSQLTGELIGAAAMLRHAG